MCKFRPGSGNFLGFSGKTWGKRGEIVEVQGLKFLFAIFYNFSSYTVRFLIHGRHARIFGQIFDQIFGQVFDQGFWPGFFGQKIQCTGLPGQRNTVLQFDRDRKIQFYSSTGTEKSNLFESHIIESPRC